MQNVINAHKLFKNRYDNVKPFYKHRNINIVTSFY